MSNNYATEIPLLFKLLKRPAFRFVIIRFNHYSLVKQLKTDLKNKFPHRPFFALDAAPLTYRALMDQYFSTENGIIVVENFHEILRLEKTSTGKETPEQVVKNDRRRGLAAGMNLRRDKLAQLNNALIVLVFDDEKALLLQKMMRWMPDLWSFRSLILDLEVDYDSLPTNEKTTPSPTFESLTPIVAPVSNAKFARNEKEIRRLEKALAEAAEEEIGLKLSIYPQLTQLLDDNGKYARAVFYYDEWLEIAQEDLFTIYNNKGLVLEKMGNLSAAKASFEQALDIAQKNDDFDRQSIAYQNIGDIFSKLGDLSVALENYQQLEKLSKILLEQAPDNIRFKNNLAISYSKLGETHSALGQLDKALQFFEKDAGISEELFKALPDNVSFKNGLAIAYANLGSTHSALGQLDKALQFFEKDAGISEELFKDFPDNVSFKNGLAISYSKLGSTHSALGQLDKALQFFEKDAGISEELFKALPDNVSFKNGLAISFWKLGNWHQQNEDLTEALDYFKKAEVLWQELATAFPNYREFTNNYNFIKNKITEVST